jgi:hypothetical protein
MKESKLGGKKHGMVLIISVGKKGDKDPTHVADPDTKKKSTHIRDDHYGKYGISDESSGKEDFREQLQQDVDRYVKPRSMRELNAESNPYAGMTTEESDEFNRRAAEKSQREQASKPIVAQKEIPAKTKEENLYSQIFDEMKTKALIDADTKKKALPPEVLGGGLLTGLGGATLTRFMDWTSNRGQTNE